MPKLTDDTWQAIREQWETGASDASLATLYGVSRQTIKRRAAAQQWQRDEACEGARERSPEGRQAHGSDGAPGQSILDRAQLAFKHQAEWAPINAFQADMLAALKSIRTWFQASVARALPSRQNRKSAPGAPNRAPGLDPRVTLDDLLKWSMTWAALHEKAASGLHKAQEGERRAHGFDFRMPQQQTAEDPATIQSRNEKIR